MHSPVRWIPRLVYTPPRQSPALSMGRGRKTLQIFLDPGSAAGLACESRPVAPRPAILKGEATNGEHKSPAPVATPSTMDRGGVVTVALLSTTIVVQSASAAETDCATVPWMDTSASPDDRAEALLAASTQHQKYRWLVEQPAVQPTRTDWKPGLAGEDPVIYPVQVACTPTIVYTDGPEAVRAAGVTDFPAQIALASTWNLDLAYDKGVAQAEEAFAKRRERHPRARASATDGLRSPAARPSTSVRTRC